MVSQVHNFSVVVHGMAASIILRLARELFLI